MAGGSRLTALRRATGDATRTFEGTATGWRAARTRLLGCAVGAGIALVLGGAALAPPHGVSDPAGWFVFLWFPTLVVAWAGSALAARVFPEHVVVGADGVLFQGRFVSHATIREVVHACQHREGQDGVPHTDQVGTPAVDTWTVTLRLDGGELLPLWRRYGDAPLSDPSGVSLAEAIKEARAAWKAARRHRTPADVAVARGDREGAAWLAYLRGLTTRTGLAYREGAAPIAAAELADLAGDEGAKPSSRAAATVALAASGDETAPMRLRDAAQRMASPRLRVALEAVAEGKDDEAIGEALVALEDAERKKRRRV